MRGSILGGGALIGVSLLVYFVYGVFGFEGGE